MNKYDFGYELEENSTNLWAYKKIRHGSRVLEIGASNGRLTKHLKEELDCVVDIVEINQEAGIIAKQYAESALIGEMEGNIESDLCLRLLGDNTYDYIVFLDVLEHLMNPGTVLKNLKAYLRDQGSILVSIPNIAHNSVLINLLQNKFEYTKLGILDDTHLHFFTFESFRKMAKLSGYCVAESGAIQKLVGDTEIKNSYDELPREVSAYLRTRSQADVYQLLFELKQETEGEECSALQTKNLEYTLYHAFVYQGIENTPILTCSVDPHDIQISVELCTNGQQCQVRIDPLNRNCLIKDVNLSGKMKDGSMINLEVNQMNGYEISQGQIVFWVDDPQIYVQCPPEVEQFEFSCKCVAYDTDILQYFENLMKQNLSMKSELTDEKKHNQDYAVYYQELLESYRAESAARIALQKKYEG